MNESSCNKSWMPPANKMEEVRSMMKRVSWESRVPTQSWLLDRFPKTAKREWWNNSTRGLSRNRKRRFHYISIKTRRTIIIRTHRSHWMHKVVKTWWAKAWYTMMLTYPQGSARQNKTLIIPKCILMMQKLSHRMMTNFPKELLKNMTLLRYSRP